MYLESKRGKGNTLQNTGISYHKTFIHQSLYIARLNYTPRVLFKYKCSSSEEFLVGGFFFSLQKFKISLKYFDVKKKHVLMSQTCFWKEAKPASPAYSCAKYRVIVGKDLKMNWVRKK